MRRVLTLRSSRRRFASRSERTIPHKFNRYYSTKHTIKSSYYYYTIQITIQSKTTPLSSTKRARERTRTTEQKPLPLKYKKSKSPIPLKEKRRMFSEWWMQMERKVYSTKTASDRLRILAEALEHTVPYDTEYFYEHRMFEEIETRECDGATTQVSRYSLGRLWVSLERPTVMRNSMVSQWPASVKWNAQYFRMKLRESRSESSLQLRQDHTNAFASSTLGSDSRCDVKLSQLEDS